MKPDVDMEILQKFEDRLIEICEEKIPQYSAKIPSEYYLIIMVDVRYKWWKKIRLEYDRNESEMNVLYLRSARDCWSWIRQKVAHEVIYEDDKTIEVICRHGDKILKKFPEAVEERLDETISEIKLYEEKQKKYKDKIEKGINESRSN